MRTRVIHLINPKTDSLTTRPIYFNRALYSPLAGLLAVAACIPRDRYEVVLTDENIEEIDFDRVPDATGVVEGLDIFKSYEPFWQDGPADRFAAVRPV